MAKSVLAVFLGMIAFVVLVMVLENVGHRLVPPPPEVLAAGTDLQKVQKAIQAAVADGKLTNQHYLVVVLAWAIASFVGGFTTAFLAPSKPLVHAGIIGLLGTLAGIMNLSAFPHPLWVWIIGIMEFMVFAVLGGMLGVRKTTPTTTLPNSP
jgi:hypothetical protein